MQRELENVSNFMREVVCEILLRDVEGLLDRYLQKTRKVGKQVGRQSGPPARL